MRVRITRRLSLLHKELVVVIITVFLVATISMISVEREPLYEGLMAVDLSAVLRLRNHEIDQVYPTLAIARTPNGSPNRGAEVVMLPAAGGSEYPLSDIQVLCRAGAPSPLESSARRFAQGIREHCEFHLPPSAQEELVRTSTQMGPDELNRRRFYLNSLPFSGLLIRCRDLIPMRFTAEMQAFSQWTKANCTFVPSWVP